MKTRGIFNAAIIAALIATIYSTQAAAWLPRQFGGSATIRLNSKISRIDPILASRADEFSVILAVFEPLIYRNPSGGIAPLLLEELPQKSSDGLTYYFKLKKDVVFHDGTALDTADALFSIQRLVKSGRSPYAWIFDGIKGTTNYRKGRATDIEGFKIIDAQRFEIQLVKANPNFLRLLCLPAAAIVSNSNRSFNPPIGSGPFRYSGSKGNGSITLSYFDGYHLGRPYLDSVKYSVVKNDDDALVEFRTAKLSITGVPPDGLRSEDKSRYPQAETGGMKLYYLLDVNPSRKALADPAARIALSASLDRAGMAKVVLNGAGQPENNAGKPQPAPAKKKPQGSAPDKKTEKVQLTMWYPDTGKAMKFLAQKIRHDAAAAGFNIALERKTLGDLLQYNSKNAPDLILRTVAAPPDSPEALDKILRSASYTSPHSCMAFRIDGGAGKYANQRTLYLTILSQKTYFLRQNEVKDFAAGAFNQIELNNLFIRNEAR